MGRQQEHRDRYQQHDQDKGAKTGIGHAPLNAPAAQKVSAKEARGAGCDRGMVGWHEDPVARPLPGLPPDRRADRGEQHAAHGARAVADTAHGDPAALPAGAGRAAARRAGRARARLVGGPASSPPRARPSSRDPAAGARDRRPARGARDCQACAPAAAHPAAVYRTWPVTREQRAIERQSALVAPEPFKG